MDNNNNLTVDNRQWWVQRWLEILDSYRFKKRLERARLYAREGNVLSIEFKGSEVLAKVQGSEIEPYQVTLSLKAFSDEDWHYIINTMAEKAIYSAQLLAGEMPENIEKVFISNGLSLFPFNLNEVYSYCSCPDKVNPCKHIGAVYYQLGDRFSEEPFIIFQLRGKSKPEILQALRQIRKEQINTNPSINIETQTKKIPEKTPQEKSKINLEKFWKYEESLDSSLVVITPPTEHQTILDLLGNFPVSSSDSKAVELYLKQVYQAISEKAVMTAINIE